LSAGGVVDSVLMIGGRSVVLLINRARVFRGYNQLRSSGTSVYYIPIPFYCSCVQELMYLCGCLIFSMQVRTLQSCNCAWASMTILIDSSLVERGLVLSLISSMAVSWLTIR